jgi:hypothetical protein
MLHEGGSLPAGDPVPEAQPAVFEQWIVEGYESASDGVVVDRASLTRLIELRKYFYETFCRRAQIEGAPPDMVCYT